MDMKCYLCWMKTHSRKNEGAVTAMKGECQSCKSVALLTSERHWANMNKTRQGERDERQKRQEA